MAEPPPPPSTRPFFKPSMIGPKPVQRQILQYLSDLSEASVSAISTSTGIKRSSIQRSLRAMKGRGLTGDRWMDYAPAVVPGIKAHMWSITNQGRGELKLLQFVTEEHEPYPLGYRILLFMSHGGLMTIGQIAKIVRKDRGHVKRVVQSLQNKGLVECLYGKTRTSFGPDMIMHLYKISDPGRQVIDAGPEDYLRMIRGSMKRMKRFPTSVV